MRGGILRAPGLAARLHGPRPQSSEPRLLPQPAAQPPSDSPADSSAGNRDLAIVPQTARKPQAEAARGRRAAAAVGLPVGTLLHLAVVGFVAVIIIGSFGSGFFLLAVPANGSVAASTRNSAHPPQPRAPDAAMSLESGIAPAPVAVAQPKSSPPTDAAPIPPPDIDAAPAPVSPAPATEAAAIVPAASRVAISSASPDDSLRNADTAPAVHAPPAPSARPSAAASPVHHGLSRSLTASQWYRTRQSGRASTRASGKPKHLAGTLTPPSRATGDPFARRASER